MSIALISIAASGICVNSARIEENIEKLFGSEVSLERTSVCVSLSSLGHTLVVRTERVVVFAALGFGESLGSQADAFERFAGSRGSILIGME